MCVYVECVCVYVCVCASDLGRPEGKGGATQMSKEVNNYKGRKEPGPSRWQTRGVAAAEVRALVAIPLSQAPHCNLCLTGHRRRSGDIPWARGNARQ